MSRYLFSFDWWQFYWVSRYWLLLLSALVSIWSFLFKYTYIFYFSTAVHSKCRRERQLWIQSTLTRFIVVIWGLCRFYTLSLLFDVQWVGKVSRLWPLNVFHCWIINGSMCYYYWALFGFGDVKFLLYFNRPLNFLKYRNWNRVLCLFDRSKKYYMCVYIFFLNRNCRFFVIR